MNILVVFGTRPEAIKMVPLVRELQKQSSMTPVVCATFQHDEMLKQVLDRFHFKVTYNLAVMTKGQTLVQITTRILLGLEGILRQEKPDLVLVQGDTTSTLIASLAAYYFKVPVAHVEAGLRSHSPYNPFPEEMNRKLTDALADYYFAPTVRSKQNLLREGIPENHIYVTGNTIVDMISQTVDSEYAHPVLKDTKGKRRILATTHRRESFGEPIRRIVRSLCHIADLYKDVALIFPVHPNPNVLRAVEEIDVAKYPNIHLLDPLDVVDCHNFLARSCLLLTDSGGLQEEAPSLGVPTIVMRTVSDRPESVELGLAKLAGTQTRDIVDSAVSWLENPPSWLHSRDSINPYGDGKASQRIVQALMYHLGLSPTPPTPFRGGEK
ncbi:non-hydrolyzing UDP-N-acetylglucosamine 2-epimerase [Pasteuria penetrans]|uniref:non-hydrolyzing UDP-N-acetylglucosamine 2-epimerase n=1 Tax=Pasteuria penetrans TaxID=86005 RepID=UPI000F998549